MFTFLKKDGGLKSYKAKKVSVGTSKNGNSYTRFQINNKLQDGTYENVSIFVWKQLPIKDDDLVEIAKINSFESLIKEFNGEKRLYTTIYADVNVLSSSDESNKVDIVGELQEIDDDSLPF